MAIIDPDGLFHGDRLRKCSTIAQLFWPRFFLAANGFARIEINYNSFLDGPLASLCPAPSKSDVMAMFREYFEHYLGFLYRCDGKVWCQFVTDERNLPRHKTKSDLRSPEPPSEEFKKWLEAYKETKQESQAIDLKDFEVIYETSEKVSEKFPKDFGADVRGVGVGVGVGEGKNIGAKRATQFPEGYQPNTSHKELAANLGVNLRDEFPAFRDFHTSKGNVFRSWDAALNTWIRNAKKFAKQQTIRIPLETGVSRKNPAEEMRRQLEAD